MWRCLEWTSSYPVGEALANVMFFGCDHDLCGWQQAGSTQSFVGGLISCLLSYVWLRHVGSKGEFRDHSGATWSCIQFTEACVYWSLWSKYWCCCHDWACPYVTRRLRNRPKVCCFFRPPKLMQSAGSGSVGTGDFLNHFNCMILVGG